MPPRGVQAMVEARQPRAPQHFHAGSPKARAPMPANGQPMPMPNQAYANAGERRGRRAPFVRPTPCRRPVDDGAQWRHTRPAAAAVPDAGIRCHGENPKRLACNGSPGKQQQQQQQQGGRTSPNREFSMVCGLLFCGARPSLGDAGPLRVSSAVRPAAPEQPSACPVQHGWFLCPKQCAALIACLPQKGGPRKDGARGVRWCVRRAEPVAAPMMVQYGAQPMQQQQQGQGPAPAPAPQQPAQVSMQRARRCFCRSLPLGSGAAAAAVRPALRCLGQRARPSRRLPLRPAGWGPSLVGLAAHPSFWQGCWA